MTLLYSRLYHCLLGNTIQQCNCLIIRYDSYMNIPPSLEVNYINISGIEKLVFFPL